MGIGVKQHIVIDTKINMTKINNKLSKLQVLQEKIIKIQIALLIPPNDIKESNGKTKIIHKQVIIFKRITESL
jgi:hypothetical protein